MYTFSPVILLIMGWAIWTTILGGLFWTPKIGKQDQNYSCVIITFIRSGIFAAFSYWAMMFLDAFVKILLLGQMGYGNIGFQLAPVILALVSGIIIIFACVFSAPTKKGIITFAVIIGVYAYYFWSTGYESLDERESIYIPLIYIFVTQIVIMILSLLIRKLLKKQPLVEPPLWNLSLKFKSILRPKIILALWIIYTIEIVSIFEGYSFFAFGPGSLVWQQIIIDLLIIVGFTTWYILDRKLQKKQIKI
jgi:hypothetical protein